MVENKKKHRQNSHLIIPFPTSEGANERVSGASKRANVRASGPLHQSVFLAVIDHSVEGLGYRYYRQFGWTAQGEKRSRSSIIVIP